MLNLPQIGFGAYRISVKSQEHREALIYALENGCGLIDTSANYTDGDSELLIGEVLQSRSDFKPLIVSKAGYIQGQNLEVIKSLPLKDEIVEIDEHLKHSIHPLFLENQLTLSLKRLQKESLDIYLLHNPEYYFYSESSSQEEYYARIEKAFLHLEQEVLRGRILEYGISSNNFILALQDPKVTDLNKIMEIVKKHDLKGFTTVQFPMNLIELGALERTGQLSLMEMIQSYGLKSMINRPLNAFSSQGLVRLATYEEIYKIPSNEEAQKQYDLCLSLIEKKWNEQDNEGENFRDIPILKQFSEMWNQLPSPDAVDQVYLGHFFPLIAGIWGGQGLSTEESQPFYDLYDVSVLLARKQMSDRARSFMSQAQRAGLLPEDDQGKPLSVLAIETYLSYGVDCVLLGMKDKLYVEQIKPFLQS